MALTDIEFSAIIDDESKAIDGNVAWDEDEDHSPAVEFRAEVQSDAGYPLFVRGSYNPLARAITFAMIHKPAGRIYALDIGKDHHNPTCQQVGERHKHRWTEQFRDKEAYVPADITAEWNDPATLWTQFCKEAKIVHRGALAPPPEVHREFWP